MTARTIETKFWHFRQNNSGGHFDLYDDIGIGVDIWIEATDAEDAERRVRALLNSYAQGGDCDCCGARWWVDAIDRDGKEMPEVDFSSRYTFAWHDTIYVHHMDGVIERIKKTEPGEGAPTF